MPKKLLPLLEVHLTLEVLGILQRRVFTQAPEGVQQASGHSWTGGDAGAVGIYNLSPDTHVTVVNEDRVSHDRRGDLSQHTYIIYPYGVSDQVETAIEEAKKRLTVQRERGT